MEYYPLRNPFTEQISISTTTSKQIPSQEGSSLSSKPLRSLDNYPLNSKNRQDTFRIDSARSVSVSRDEGKTLRDRIKDLNGTLAPSHQRNRSISPFKRPAYTQKGDMKENNGEMSYNKGIEGNNKFNGNGPKEKYSGQEKKKEVDCSYSWHEEEEDSRKEESIMTEESFREDEIREKLMQMQEDILKKMKLKGRVVQNNKSIDSSSFLNETLLTIGKPSTSPSSLANILAPNDLNRSCQNVLNKKTRLNPSAREDKSPKSLNTTIDKGRHDKLNLDFNDNYSRIVQMDIKSSDSRDSSLIKTRNFCLAVDVDPSLILGCTKLQLFLQKVKFRNLNSSFRVIREKRTLQETLRFGNMSRRETTMFETPFSRRTCVSPITERHSNIQLGSVVLKNVVNKRLQSAFFALKSLLSFHQLQYKASIASGAIILSKLFRAHERSLSLQCIGIWKLRHALQIQRDEELAQKNLEIKKLSQEKNQALFTLAEEQDRRLLTLSSQSTPKPLKQKTSNKIEQMADKENNVKDFIPPRSPSLLGQKAEKVEKVELKENNDEKERSVLIKKTPDILDETRRANRLLYEQLKALYDKKSIVEELPPKPSKPLGALSNNTSYQKPFMLGQPKKNVAENKNNVNEGMVLRVSTGRLTNSRESYNESEDRSLSSKQLSKRSSLATNAYDSLDKDLFSNCKQSRRGSTKLWE